MRLLVVEDEARLASALQRGLQAEGFAVDIAADGLGVCDACDNPSMDRPQTAIAPPMRWPGGDCRERSEAG